MVAQDLAAKLLEAAEEHPRLHCDHRRVTVVSAHAEPSVDKARTEVSVGLRVMLLHPCTHPFAQTRAPHVRRVRDHHVVAPAQRFELGLQALQLLCRKPAEDRLFACKGREVPCDGFQVFGAHGEQAAAFVQMRRRIHELRAITEVSDILQLLGLKLNAVEHGYARTHTTAQKARVQLACLHRQRERCHGACARVDLHA